MFAIRRQQSQATLLLQNSLAQKCQRQGGDAIVRFDALPESAIEAITEKELREIAAREGLRKYNLHLSWSREVVAQLAKTGFDARYGARPLQRAIETHVVTPLAQLLVNQAVPTRSQIRLRLEASNVIVPEVVDL